MKTHLTFLKAARSPQWKFSPGGIQRPFLELLPCRGLTKQNNKNALFITSREKLYLDTFLLSIFVYNSSLLTQTTTQSVRSKLLQILNYIYIDKRIHEKGFKTLKNHLQIIMYIFRHKSPIFLYEKLGYHTIVCGKDSFQGGIYSEYQL